MPEIIDSFFNEENHTFEVWKYDEENNIKSKLLSMTVEEVNQLLKQHIIQTLLDMESQ
jgi:hypothetical protein